MTDTKDQAMLWMLECVNIRIFMEKVSRPKYVRSSSLSISRLWGEGTRQNRKGKGSEEGETPLFHPRSKCQISSALNPWEGQA